MPTTVTAARAQGAALVLSRVVVLQFGAALAASLFPDLGPLGVVSVRLVAGAAALCLVVRPRLGGRTAAQWRVLVGVGVLTAAMNTRPYPSVVRLPLRAALTLSVLR